MEHDVDAAAEPGAPGREIALAVIVGALGILALRAAAKIVVPVLVSVLCSYALEPVVAWLSDRRVPRPIAAALVYVALIAALALAARGIGPRIASFVDSMPDTVARIQEIARDAQPSSSSLFGRLKASATRLQRTLATPAAPAPGLRRVEIAPRFDVHQQFAQATRHLAEAGADVLAVGIMTFLLLASGDLYKRKIVKIAGARFADRRITIDVIRSVDRQIERYLVARLTISAIVAAGTTAALAVIGIDNALVWGLVAGVLNVFPYFGPALGIALITLAAFVQTGAVGPTAAAGGAEFLIAALEGNVISPLLLSRAGELNTVAVFVGVLIWGWMWDAWGLLLAIPIMVGVKAAADHIESMKPIGELLGR